MFDKFNALNRLLQTWYFKTNNYKNIDIVDDTAEEPIVQVINKRTERFNIKIPVELGYIIALCSNGNPGMAIIIYYTLLKGIVRKNGKFPRNGYLITIDDYRAVFGNKFPDIDEPIKRDKYRRLWDEQKDEKGRNKVDTYEYWNELFE